LKTFSAIVRAVCSSAAAKCIVPQSSLSAAATTAHPAAFGRCIFFQLLLCRRLEIKFLVDFEIEQQCYLIFP